ncbi:MAG: sulfatase-like hydrolase/transferase [Bacteroidia bacterium]|nr:sulfatase-like hydrolase/transferase [Bacteroidia bacterium]
MKTNITLMKKELLLPLVLIGEVLVPKVVSASEPKQNIIFILVDDLGYGELSCYSQQSNVKTPNIDKLAQFGVRMTQAYASPVSSPTRASFLTGCFPQKVGVYSNFDGPNPGIGPLRDAFPQVLQQNGYRTCWFGKWHQGWDISNHPLNNGFDVAYGFLGGMHDYYNPAVGDHYSGGPYAPHAFVFDGFKVVKSMNYFTDEITDRAINVINEKSEKPFFIYLAYSAPHTPIQAPDKAILKYMKAGVDTVQAVRSAMIDVLDENVGRVMSALKAKKLDKNTLVVFMSDNGAQKQKNNGGLRGTKMTAWEGGIRVPLIASLPGVIPVERTSDAICSVADMAATFVSLSNPENGLKYGDGVDLMPYWKAEKKGNAHDALVFSINVSDDNGGKPTTENLELFGVRMGDWKLVRDSKRGIDELYNLSEDPAEITDLSLKNPEKKAELLNYGADFFKDCKPSSGPLVSKDTRPNGDKLMINALLKHCRTLQK